jgi:hypothetical protein
MTIFPPTIHFRRVCRLATAGGLLICSLRTQGGNVEPDPQDDLSEIVVQAAEPRFVAPTLRDRIGRIWAPVWINGSGPFAIQPWSR